MALLLPLLGCGPGGAPGAEPPSLILISIDTARADHFSLYGYERDTTPRLARLAPESLVFERAYSTAAWTQPSHMSMFTGLYPKQHQIHGRSKALSPAIPTLAQRLKDEGYYASAYYQPSWLDERYGFHRGFDEFEPHADGAEADARVRGLTKRLRREPRFFLFVHLFDVHNKEFDEPRALPYDGPGRFPTTFLTDAKKRLRGVSAKDLWTGKREHSAEELEAVVALYDGGLRYVDHLIGGWVEEWRAAGLLDRAVLIVTGDHGEPLGQREGKLNGHGERWEEGLHVPLLVRLPGGERGGERRVQPVSLVDLVPTVLDLVGLPTESGLPGRSLLAPRDPAAPIVAQQTEWTVVLVDSLKYVVLNPGRSNAEEFLYDLARDPAEEHPLEPADAPEAFARARAELAPLVGRESPYVGHEHRPIPARELDESQVEQLRNLGYLGDE